MISRSVDTPCPLQSREASSTGFSTIWSEDTTTNLDYTRLVRQEFITAKPRRPRRAGRADDVTVFEDEGERQELGHEQKRLPAPTDTTKRSPARLISNAAIVLPVSQSTKKLAAAQEDVHSAQTPNGCSNRSKDFGRPAIFAPMTTTTIGTIVPIGSNTRLPNDTVHAAWQRRSTESETRRKNLHKAPSITLRSTPRRVPLGAVWATQNASISIVDMPGDATGKENVPPGGGMGGVPKAASKVVVTRAGELSGQNRISSLRFQPKAVGLGTHRGSTAPGTVAHCAKSTNKEPADIVVSLGVIFSPLQCSKDSTQENTSDGTDVSFPVGKQVQDIGVESSAKGQPSKQYSSISSALRTESTAASRVDQYKAIAQDVRTPGVYEDQWLDVEEAALAELLNHVLAQAEPRRPDSTSESIALRGQLLDVYQTAHATTMLARLRAAIQVGGLKIPDSALDSSDPTKDIGLRRGYMSLFLSTFSQKLLKVAAEVVVGKTIPTTTDVPSTSPGLIAAEKILDVHNSRRTLTAFLETFFVRADDLIVKPSSNHHEIQRQRHDKRLLRSLLLVWVLDQAKHSCNTKPLLFRRTSTHRSTSSVLQSLAALLVPSLGDTSRALRHSGYALMHTQPPLDEIAHQVKNLAIDLRDGTILARLADVLSAGSGSPYLQRLSIPCHARAKKLANVDIVLGALSVDYRLERLPSSVAIVDGHRENTVSLLWSLIANFALEKMIDWKYLAKDTAAVHLSDVRPLDYDAQQVDEYSNRLLEWAAAHCRSRGNLVTNLTTSFADGRAYLELIRSYIDRILIEQIQSQGNPQDMQDCMRSIGCGNAVIKHFTSAHRTTIPSQVTTLANLALLAATLLPLRRRWDAAIVVQRAFRKRRRISIGLLKAAANPS